MIITVISELVIGRRKFLKTLKSDGVEVTTEFGEFSEDNCSS